jgi:2-phospho-L-lactate/phosphoenolpyruvate guanylyltransferase
MQQDVLMAASTSSPPRWVVLVPVKALAGAKSRLAATSSGARRSLSLAFAVDTMAAARSCALVDRLVVVTADDDVRHAAAELGASSIPEPAHGGLNQALRHAEAVLRGDAARDEPGPDDELTRGTGATSAWGTAIAALAGDLPALRPDELERALAAAGAFPRAFVGDAAGTGTTLLSALPGFALDPHFGPRSHAAHVVSGAVSLELSAIPGLRRDVDTEVDLWDAVRIGAGAATSALLSS